MKLSMMIRSISSTLVVLLLWSVVTPSQCPGRLSYVNRNQVDPDEISLNRVVGRAVDSRGVAVPEICIGLFTNKGHRLIAQVRANSEGRFAFKALPEGRYRLVARMPNYDYLCPVNARVRIMKARRKKQSMTLHLVPRSLDQCSWADVK